MYIQQPTIENLIESINELKEKFLAYERGELEPAIDTTQEGNTDSNPTPDDASPGVSTPRSGKEQQEIADQAANKDSKPNEQDANKTDEKGVVVSVPKDISFIFFYDLIQSIIDVIMLEDGTADKIATQLLTKFYILHTNISMPSMEHGFSSDPATWKPFNIAATPIAISTFNNYVANVSEQAKEKYPLYSVIRDLFNQIVSDVIGSDCIDKFNGPSFIQKITQITDYSGDQTKIDGYSLQAAYTPSSVRHPSCIDARNFLYELEEFLPVTEQIANGSVSRPLEIMVLSLENRAYRDAAKGITTNDIKTGIPHFTFNYKRGIQKKVVLSKTDQPFLREARFTDKTGYSLLQLSNVYDIEITMHGNNSFINGSLIYFDPSMATGYLGSPKDDNSLSSIMGIGGLYIVTSIKNKYDIGGYTTTIKARFVSRGTI